MEHWKEITSIILLVHGFNSDCLNFPIIIDNHLFGILYLLLANFSETYKVSLQYQGSIQKKLYDYGKENNLQFALYANWCHNVEYPEHVSAIWVAN